MPSTSTYVALAGAVASAQAAFQGFNYGNTFTDGSIKAQSDYESEFKNAAGLEGTNGAFNSARLYTMIQGGSTSDPNQAIPAAIKTKTSMLFGLWASAGQDAFDNEIAALKNTIDQYCDQLDGLVAGISVGSEDLYRASPIGVAAGENPGADAETLVNYINEVRKTIKGSCMKDTPIGHVDTWTAYVEGSSDPLIEACDWLGMDAYPYFEDTKTNPISEGKNLFQSALDKVKGVSGGRDVWITETGWPVSGKTVGQGVPSLKNAKTYWDEVGCPMFGNTNVWWYTMQDAAPTTPNPSFGIVGSDLTEKPLYDLSCDGVDTGSDKTSTTKTKATSQKTTTNDEPKPTTGAETTAVTTSDSADTTTGSSAEETSAGSTTVAETSMTSPDATTAVSTGSGNATLVSPTTSPTGGNAGSTTVVVQPAPTTEGGSGSGSGSGSQPSTTTVPGVGGQLNSFGAAAAALVIAVAIL